MRGLPLRVGRDDPDRPAPLPSPPHSWAGTVAHLLTRSQAGALDLRGRSPEPRAPPLRASPSRFVFNAAARGRSRPGFAEPRTLPQGGSSRKRAGADSRAAVAPGPPPGPPALVILDRWPWRRLAAANTRELCGLRDPSPRPHTQSEGPPGGLWIS